MVAARDAEWAEVSFGIEPGDIYAARNSFIIKAELAKVRGLPASTTRVGTNGTATPTREYKTFQEAAEAAMAELMAGNR